MNGFRSAIVAWNPEFARTAAAEVTPLRASSLFAVCAALFVAKQTWEPDGGPWGWIGYLWYAGIALLVLSVSAQPSADRARRLDGWTLCSDRRRLALTLGTMCGSGAMGGLILVAAGTARLLDHENLLPLLASLLWSIASATLLHAVSAYRLAEYARDPGPRVVPGRVISVLGLLVSFGGTATAMFLQDRGAQVDWFGVRISAVGWFCLPALVVVLSSVAAAVRLRTPSAFSSRRPPWPMICGICGVWLTLVGLGNWSAGWLATAAVAGVSPFLAARPRRWSWEEFRASPVAAAAACATAAAAAAVGANAWGAAWEGLPWLMPYGFEEYRHRPEIERQLALLVAILAIYQLRDLAAWLALTGWARRERSAGLLWLVWVALVWMLLTPLLAESGVPWPVLALLAYPWAAADFGTLWMLPDTQVALTHQSAVVPIAIFSLVVILWSARRVWRSAEAGGAPKGAT